MRRLLLLASVVVLTLSTPSSFGQFGHKPAKAGEAAGKTTEYSEDDKKKLAEIAQRPAVQEEIQKAWDVLRNEQIQAAYAINQTSTWALTDDPISKPGFSPCPATGDRTNCRSSDHLYSNPMVQAYINTIGQKVVPKDSPNFYTFRVLSDPMPKAISLTTGSVYISTGLLAMLDSEAQLSYILAHEVAHVEQKHVYTALRNHILDQELVKEKEAKAERTKAILDIAGAVGGGLLGGKLGGVNGALLGGLGGLGAGLVIGNLVVHEGIHETEWSTENEDEADALGAKYALGQGYDIREIPRLYASLDNMVSKDSRTGLSFMGDPTRVKQRTGHIKEMISGPLKEQVDTLVKSGHMVGSGPTFPVLLSAAKRDNGILAMQYDLFGEARQNLEDSLEQRSNDPAVHFYLSKVMALTAKTPEDQRAAVAHITDAIKLDATRGSIPDLHLEYAIALISQGNVANKDQVIGELKTYVALYQRDNAGQLPHNMTAIFDYFNLEGENSWYLPPTWYTATQLTNNNGISTLAPDAVVRKATGGAVDPEAMPVSAPAAPAAPATKTKATPKS